MSILSPPPDFFEICGQLLRYCEKINPQRIKDTPPVNFCSRLASAPHMCKSSLFNSYFFWILLSLWRTAAFCLLLLYRNKMQHRAFRLYLFAAAALLRRCFSASAPKTADAFSSSKKDTASIAVRRIFSIYMYESPPYRRNWLWGKYKNYYSSFS